MRIFVLVSRVPYPLEKGDKLRAYHQIRELSKKHEIILCALNPIKGVNKQKAFDTVQPYCRSINFIDLPFPVRLWNIILAFFKGLPLQVGYFYSRRAQKKINRLMAEYNPNAVYCQLVRTAEYVRKINIPKIIDYQDVFSYGVKRRAQRAPFWLKPLLHLEYKRLVRYENRIFDDFDHKTIISEPDRNLITHPLKKQIAIVRNGVDFEFFTPRNTEKKYEVVFTGNMHYPPNVDAARFLVKEVMPLVWKERPATSVLLAGANPDPAVKALADRQVFVSGWLDDIRDAYASSMLFIAPMRIGTGLQNKLLEAMSMKIAAITTPLANEALEATPGKEIMVGETAEDLAKSILKLLEDNNFRNQLAENGHAFVKKNFSWEGATAPLLNMIERTGSPKGV